MIIRPLTIMSHVPVPPEPPGPVFPYQTVTIGTQTWMAESLREDDGQGGVYKRENVTVNGVNYGDVYTYTQAAAIRIANNIDGWHLPSRSEVDTLVSYVNNGNYNSDLVIKLKSTTGWPAGYEGTDLYGWNMKPVGWNYTDGTPVVNEYVMWESDARWYMTYNNRTGNSGAPSGQMFVVRLIKDV